MHALRTLADLLPNPRTADDLRWFFREADGECGLRSNYPGMIQRLQAPLTFSSRLRSEPDVRWLHASTRARRISRALEQIGHDHTLTLREAFNGLAPAVLHAYDELAALALQVGVGPHRRSRTSRTLLDWLARIARNATKTPAAARWLAEVRGLAREQLDEALRAFEIARKNR
jgi:hypothetical protein